MDPLRQSPLQCAVRSESRPHILRSRCTCMVAARKSIAVISLKGKASAFSASQERQHRGRVQVGACDQDRSSSRLGIMLRWTEGCTSGCTSSWRCCPGHLYVNRGPTERECGSVRESGRARESARTLCGRGTDVDGDDALCVARARLLDGRRALDRARLRLAAHAFAQLCSRS